MTKPLTPNFQLEKKNTYPIKKFVHSTIKRYKLLVSSFFSTNYKQDSPVEKYGCLSIFDHKRFLQSAGIFWASLLFFVKNMLHFSVICDPFVSTGKSVKLFSYLISFFTHKNLRVYRKSLEFFDFLLLKRYFVHFSLHN